MKILFVVAYAPNPVRVRPYQFIRTLLARGNQVTVASLWTSSAEEADLKHLEALGAKVLASEIGRSRTYRNLARAFFSPASLQSWWSWEPSLFNQMCAALQTERYDAIHVEHLRGSQYALALQQYVASGKALGSPPVVWDSVDSISALFAQAQKLSPSLKTRMMTGLDYGRTERDEGMLATAFPRIVITSQGDLEALVALAEKRTKGQGVVARDAMRVIPNGVDTEAFAFRDGSARDGMRLVYSGKMSYHANAATARFLVEEIMPIVWRKQPQATLWVVGKDPGKEMQEWTRRYPERVVVTGEVPDMGAVISTAAVALAPLVYGAGIQNKVLEAMACGTPVIASPLAVSPLRAQPGVDLEVADGAQAFAEATLRLLEDPARRDAMARSGRAYVENYHSWDAVTAQLEETYREAALQA
jgi:hypothetical protein